MSIGHKKSSLLDDYVRRFRLVRGLGRELDAAMEDAFRGRICDRLTLRLFADKCPKIRRDLLGRLLGVDKGTRSRWLHGVAPSYESVFRGLLVRRAVFQGVALGEEDDIVADATACALMVVRGSIDVGSFETASADLVRRIHQAVKRTHSGFGEAPRRTGTRSEADNPIALAPSEQDSRLLRDWFLPWIVFHHATDHQWRLTNEG